MQFSVVAAAASVECLGRCPVPPAPFGISIAAAGVSVSPRRARPSLPSGGCSLVAWLVGGFSSPPPCTRPSSPRLDWDAVRSSRVAYPLGPPSSLGFKSSCDNSISPTFSFLVESSGHDSTPPPLPLGVESSWGDSTPPPYPWRVESSVDNSTPPPHSLGPPPGFSFTQEASRPLSSPSTPWGWGPLRRPHGPHSFAPLPRVLLFPIPVSLLFSPLAHASPHGGPASPPCRPSRRGLSGRRSHRPSHPPVALLPLLCCKPHGDAISRACPNPSSSVSASDVASLHSLHPSLLAFPPSPPLPTSLGPLQPLAPAHGLLPPAPVADIARKDKDFGNRTGGVVACGLLAGGSAPNGNAPKGLAP